MLTIPMQVLAMRICDDGKGNMVTCPATAVNAPAQSPALHGDPSAPYQSVDAGRHRGGDRTCAVVREKIAALPARYPYIGAATKNVYLFTPTESERDLIVQALCAFAAASPENGSA